MSTEDDLAALVLKVEEGVWQLHGASLASFEKEVSALCHGSGIEPSIVLAEQSDETLVLGINAGFFPKLALEELLSKRYRRMLIGSFRRWGSRIDEWEDLAQDVFLRLHEKALAGFDPSRASFRTYLFVVARSVLSDSRRRKRQPAVQVPEDWPARGELLQGIMARELLDQCQRAINLLEPQQQAVIRLAAEEYAPREISARLKIPIRNVYQLLFKARKALNEHLHLHLGPSGRGRPRHDGT